MATKDLSKQPQVGGIEASLIRVNILPIMLYMLIIDTTQHHIHAMVPRYDISSKLVWNYLNWCPFWCLSLVP